MLLQQALSLVAIGIVAISNTQFVKAEPLTTSNALAVVHGVKGKPIQLSANYLAGFDADDAPEPKFELVDTPEADIGSKIVSLRKRGSGCAEYYTGKLTLLLGGQKYQSLTHISNHSRKGRFMPRHCQGIWTLDLRVHGP